MRAAIAALLHIAAQRHAARRAALAHAGGDQRLRHRAGGQHHQRARSSCTASADLAGARRPRARRRAAAPRSAPARAARAGAHRGAADDVVELAPRQHRQAPGHVDAAAARPDAADVPHALRAAPSPRRSTPSRCSAVCASGIRPSPHTLSRGNACCVDQHDVQAGARQQLRAGAAGRAGADDQHVARGWQGGGAHEFMQARSRARKAADCREASARRSLSGRLERRGLLRLPGLDLQAPRVQQRLGVAARLLLALEHQVAAPPCTRPRCRSGRPSAGTADRRRSAGRPPRPCARRSRRTCALVTTPCCSQLAMCWLRDAQRGAVFHQADVVDVGHLGAAHALVDPAHHVAQDALRVVVELLLALGRRSSRASAATGTSAGRPAALSRSASASIFSSSFCTAATSTWW